MAARELVISSWFVVYRKIFLFFVLLVTCYLLLVTYLPPAFAQGTPPAAGTTSAAGTTPAAAPWNAQNQSNFTSQTLQHAILCDLVFMSPLGRCVGFEKDPSKKDGVKVSLYGPQFGGALGSLTNMAVALYQPPTSTVYYLADVAKGFGIITPAYAQVTGSGAGIIEPVKKLWEVMRNFAYLAFIIIFLAIGFMIMFRQKLNAQTVLTVQAALPGLVLSLILVFLSYFIAAFLIDLAFLSVQILAWLFIQNGLANSFGDAAGIQSLAQNSNILELFKNSFRFEAFGEVTGGVSGTVNSVFGGSAAGPNALAIIIPAIIGSVIAFFIFPPGGLVALGVTAGGGAAAGLLAPLIIGLLVPLILIIALAIQFFKLLFKLIMAYVMLLVTTILGPLLILVSAVPGKGTSLSFWWKNLLGNALVFPAVFGTFLFAGMILATDPSAWKASPPLFGGLSTELLRLIIAYGIILGTPAVPDMVKKMIGAGDLGEIGKTGAAGFFAGFGVGKGAGTAGVNRLLAPTMQLRNERRTLQEQAALGKLGPLGEARLAALQRGAYNVYPTGKKNKQGEYERDTEGNLETESRGRTWWPSKIQRWLVETGNKAWSGKK
ncbi:hypothetical protein HYW46_06780 [Candidatus Daviesbacteria bacterium]|nr:hypothetical protein [Candidatus Daviesbacteria bacterium]